MLNKEEVEKRVMESYEIPNNVVNAMPDPVVTVRTPAYNHAPYIRECIESVLMQETDFPFEYIIGEDFSTDGTREIVMEYAEKYPDIIRVLTADQNVGAKANGIRGIRSTRGKYVALCEGDDYWTDPRKLQKQVDVLESHPDVVLCHHWQSLSVQDDAGNWCVIDAPKQGHGYWPKEIATVADVFSNRMRCKTRTVMFRNVYKDMQVPEWIYDCRFGDVPLSFVLGRLGKFFFIDEVMAVYRQTGVGISSTWRGTPEYFMNHYMEWIKIWDYGVRHYSYEYAQEGRAVVLGFYRKILSSSGFFDILLLCRFLSHRINFAEGKLIYDGWILLRLPLVFVEDRFKRLRKRFLSYGKS